MKRPGHDLSHQDNKRRTLHSEHDGNNNVTDENAVKPIDKDLLLKMSRVLTIWCKKRITQYDPWLYVFLG